MRDDTGRKPGTGQAPMAPERDEEIPGLGLAVKWGARSLEELKGLGKRVFVHILGMICGGAAALSTGSIAAGLCVYFGGVCLLARGISPTADWLLPTGAGLVQAVLSGFLGFPLPQAIFWGGAQTWLQRLLQKRFRMGGEWIMLLFILPMGIYLVGSGPVLRLAGSFAAVAAAGGILVQAVARRRALLAAAEERRRLGPPEPEKVAVYRASLEAFREKVGNLPRNTRPVGESLAQWTGCILDSMAGDARDLEPGHRFLNRYFKAAHSLVDRHIALARENVITAEVVEALEKSSETLARLDEVFAKEHARLLRNDVTDFSADLAVIDTLLKMDGR